MSSKSVAQTAPAYRMIGRTMIIQSSADPRKSYNVTDRGCTCKGYRFYAKCKHVDTRAEVLASRKPQTDAEYLKTLAAADELF